MTTVSIITPVYGVLRDAYQRTEDSIAEQTNKDFEWIVVNDGDEGWVNFADVSLKHNYGPSVARNAGFQISSGSIITYIDMGDTLAPDRVENLIKLFTDYKVELMFSAYNILYPSGHYQKFDHFNFIGRSSRYPTAVEYMQLFEYKNMSVPMGVAHNRRAFVQAGGFQRGIVCGEDGVLWRRMIHNTDPTKILFSDDIAGNYYNNPEGQSGTQRRFEMGGFAIDGERNDNGRYLDKEWFKTYSSEGLYD